MNVQSEKLDQPVVIPVRGIFLYAGTDAICAEQRPLVRLPAATRRSTTATLIKAFR